MVEKARSHVPFYRERLADWDLVGQDDFVRLPLLIKPEIIGQEHQLISVEVDPASLLEETTSGSSGTPLRCFKSKSERIELAMHLWRLRAEQGRITPSDRMAEFYGFIQDGARFRTGAIEMDGRSLCLSMLDLSPSALHRYYRALCDYQPTWFFSVPSALTVLANHMLDYGLPGPATGIRYIETTGEMLFDYQKRVVETAFGCPVYNHYGCREFWLLAMSCPYGNLHLEQDHIYTEFIPVPDDPGATELVVTSLRNTEWPLIRYRLGDRVRPGVGTCSCGRPGPVLAGLAGRATELLRIGNWTANTILFFYAVSQVNALFPDSIRQFRITQTNETELLMQCVAGRGISQEAKAVMLQALLDKLPGEARLALELVASIPIDGRKHTYFSPYDREETRRD